MAADRTMVRCSSPYLEVQIDAACGLAINEPVITEVYLINDMAADRTMVRCSSPYLEVQIDAACGLAINEH
jgi:hypothetical protein